MSELINKHDNRAIIRWKLLASVSAFALAASLPATASADSDRPILWFEAGMQLDRLSDQQENYSPPFVEAVLQNPFTPPSAVQMPPRYSFGEEGKLSFAPEGSNWIFSAVIRFGRTSSSHNAHEETARPSLHVVISEPLRNYYRDTPVQPLAIRYATTTSRISDSYRIMDFEAGRDVGLGMFGSLGTSTFSAGVRFAQFASRSKVRIDSDPDFSALYSQFNFGPYHSSYFKFPNKQSWNLYSGKITASHSFHGIGPSLEWDADAILAGNTNSGAITADWGVNAALLFGRQRTVAHHETMAHHGSHIPSAALPTLYPTAVHDTARSHSITVPNVGGFAGLSLRYNNAKISLGYRADFFFNAMDGGIDAAKKENRGFYGPFASISIGVGGSSN